MEVKVSNEKGEHAETEDEVTYLWLSRDEEFASESISREKLFLIGANTKYSRAVRVNSRYITWKTICSYINV